MIDTLIDKKDTFEIVRDKIAAILKVEVAEQQVLAEAAGKPPALWDLDIYSESFNPWEKWLNSKAPNYNLTPIVNVRFESLTDDKAASNVVERQKVDAVYNIDMYGLGIAKSNDDGHIAGDYAAALESQRATRLVRNILMAANYTYLDLRGLVWGRWVDSITSFDPELNGRQMQRIMGTRIRFGVVFNEFSPQITPEILQTITATVKRAEDGQILLVTEYDYTA